MTPPAQAVGTMTTSGAEVTMSRDDDEPTDAIAGGRHLALCGAGAARIGAMGEVTSAILGSVSAEDLPRAIVDAAARVLGADDVSLLLPSSETELYVAHASGLSAAIKSTTRIRLGEGVAGKAAAARTPLILQSDVGTARGYTESATRRVRSSIIYPLVLGPDLLGVLTANRRDGREPFDASDLERAGILAAEVGLALRNAALVRRLVGTERLVAVGQLASGIAHEVNNPVACILANLEYCLDELSSGQPLAPDRLEEQRQAISDSIDAARRIRDVVAELRRFSTGRGAPTDRVDVGATLRAAVQMTLPRTRGRGPTTIAQAQDVWVGGEGPRLLQVFVSAILHVHANSDEAAADAALAITVEAGEASVRIDVEGVAATEPPSGVLGGIFAIEGDQTELGGLGVGLYAARDIVRTWGGDLTEKREGGRFRVSVRVPATFGGAK